MKCSECPVRGYTIYRSIDPDEWKGLEQARSGHLTFKRGQVIMEDHRRSDSVYTLVKGWAYYYALLADGRRQILHFFQPGDFMTIPALTEDGIRASVRCLTDVAACRFDKVKFRELLRQSQKFNDGLFEYVSVLRRDNESRLIELGTLKAEERVAALILEFVRRARGRGESGGEIEFPLHLIEIAEAVGITEIHAGRVIRGLERKGAITRTNCGTLKIDEAQLGEIISAARPVLFPG